MENKNLFNHNNETGDPTKKENLTENSVQTGQISDNDRPVSDDDYLKLAMEPDTPLKAGTGKIQSSMSRTRRSKSQGLTEKEYFETFFKIPKQNASKGRTVYIRPEFHQKFLKLIAGLEIDRLTMYAYLDNIIEHHFTEFEETIYKIYQDRNKPLF
ncbi:DUF3408 domain-containing protein [Chryseobacterium angstadtii]|nr:DUF3408 domain-containing protein [Chryseobacterium angstadtii]